MFIKNIFKTEFGEKERDTLAKTKKYVNMIKNDKFFKNSHAG